MSELPPTMRGGDCSVNKFDRSATRVLGKRLVMCIGQGGSLAHPRFNCTTLCNPQALSVRLAEKMGEIVLRKGNFSLNVDFKIMMP